MLNRPTKRSQGSGRSSFFSRSHTLGDTLDVVSCQTDLRRAQTKHDEFTCLDIFTIGDPRSLCIRQVISQEMQLRGCDRPASLATSAKIGPLQVLDYILPLSTKEIEETGQSGSTEDTLPIALASNNCQMYSFHLTLRKTVAVTKLRRNRNYLNSRG